MPLACYRKAKIGQDKQLYQCRRGQNARFASGGVGNLQHLVEGVTQGHASAVLAASIFHFGEASIADAHAALREAGLAVRTAGSTWHLKNDLSN